MRTHSLGMEQKIFDPLPLELFQAISGNDESPEGAVENMWKKRATA